MILKVIAKEGEEGEKLTLKISIQILCSSVFSILIPERSLAIRHEDGAYELTLYSSNLSLIMAIPFVKFSRERYKIKMIFGKNYTVVK